MLRKPNYARVGLKMKTNTKQYESKKPEWRTLSKKSESGTKKQDGK